VLWRRRRPSWGVSDEDWRSLVIFLMGMDRKLDLIIEELEIDDAEGD
jgi:hypothetical protein